MRHLRTDYEAIQPWPTRRPHVARVDGETTEIDPCPAVIHGGPGSQSSHLCDRLGPHTYHYSADYDLWWETDEGWANSGTNVIDEPVGDVPEMDPIIPDDEPVFLLRAKDAFAPELVRSWAEWLLIEDPVHRAHFHANITAETCERCATASRVFDWADEMERYAAEHYDGGKTPDTPSEFLRGSNE